MLNNKIILPNTEQVGNIHSHRNAASTEIARARELMTTMLDSINTVLATRSNPEKNDKLLLAKYAPKIVGVKPWENLRREKILVEIADEIYNFHLQITYFLFSTNIVISGGEHSEEVIQRLRSRLGISSEDSNLTDAISLLISDSITFGLWEHWKRLIAYQTDLNHIANKLAITNKQNTPTQKSSRRKKDQEPRVKSNWPKAIAADITQINVLSIKLINEIILILEMPFDYDQISNDSRIDDRISIFLIAYLPKIYGTAPWKNKDRESLIAELKQDVQYFLLRSLRLIFVLEQLGLIAETDSNINQRTPAITPPYSPQENTRKLWSCWVQLQNATNNLH